MMEDLSYTLFQTTSANAEFTQQMYKDIVIVTHQRWYLQLWDLLVYKAM